MLNLRLYENEEMHKKVTILNLPEFVCGGHLGLCFVERARDVVEGGHDGLRLCVDLQRGLRRRRNRGGRDAELGEERLGGLEVSADRL